MWNQALLPSALFAALTYANPHLFARQSNSSSTSLSLSSQSTSSIYEVDLSSTSTSRSGSTSSASTSAASSSAPSSSSRSSSHSSSATGSSSATSSSSSTQTSTVRTTSSKISTSSLTISNTTSLATTNLTTPKPTGICTGCVLEAIRPVTLSFDESRSSTWTSVVVTETILTVIATYYDHSTIDGVVTEYTTLNQTQTVYGPANKTIVHTTPVFTWRPAAGTTVTLAAGPTYVAYTNLWGGLDYAVGSIGTAATPALKPSLEPSCAPESSPLSVVPASPEEYHYFIETYVKEAPTADPSVPTRLPPALIEHLKKNPRISSIFSGSDIGTCTVAPPSTHPITGSPVFESTIFFTPQPSPSGQPYPSRVTGSAPGVVPTHVTETYISKTYETTSQHVTRQGCLRCSTPVQPQPAPPEITDYGRKPNDPPNPPNPSNPSPPNNPQSQNPNDPARPNLFTAPPNYPEQTITIGGSEVPIRPAQPTQPGQPNDPNRQNPNIIIGSETLTPGQTTTMNGVVVVVPTQAGGTNIVVGGSTVAVAPAPTGPPILTVGQNTITANSQGQFVVGTQTLTPGGPAITVGGSTLSLGPSGTIAVVNGVTQTLGNAPFVTAAPVITVGAQTVSATVIGGSTQFILAPGQTLTPGGVITVGGTTFSMPADGRGSTIVVNGVTSTLNAAGVPVLTLNGNAITASIVGGTTAYVLGPGQTLTPGAVITVSGTTFSMPASASGSVVVINGVTSTLGNPLITAAPALTIDGKTFSATVRDGTTEYVLGPGTTLKPGDAITVSGTTYSLDPKGTALVVNGKTSSIPKTPASNSASTTDSASKSQSTTGSSSSASSSTSQRDPGNFIASGIGASSKGAAANARTGGLDKTVEGIMMGIAGWLLMLL